MLQHSGHGEGLPLAIIVPLAAGDIAWPGPQVVADLHSAVTQLYTHEVFLSPKEVSGENMKVLSNSESRKTGMAPAMASQTSGPSVVLQE